MAFNVWGGLNKWESGGGGVTVIPSANRGSFTSMTSYLRGLGTYNSGQSNDLIVEWLVSEGVDRGHINNMLNNYWGSLGYTGAFNDRWKRWRDE